MNFLAPWFLLGGLTLGLPILFHLIQRTVKTRQAFSSLQFLSPSPPRLTRRSKLTDLLLLLLRLVALLLLVTGFSRPFLPTVKLLTGGAQPRRRLILVDTSASMRRSGLWSEALSHAETALKESSTDDQVAIYAFDKNLRPVMTFDEWRSSPQDGRRALASKRLAGLTSTWGTTRIGEALTQSAELIAEQDNSPKTSARPQLIVISDQQEGGHFEELASYEWPPGIDVALVPVHPRPGGNTGLQWLPPKTDAAPAETVRVRIFNTADSHHDRFEVGWGATRGGGFLGSPVQVRVPSGESRTLSIPISSRSGSDRIILRGDDEDFDNTIYVAPPTSDPVVILYLGDESPTDSHQPLFFLKKALVQAGRRPVQVQTATTKLIPTSAQLAAAAWVVMTTQPSVESVPTLRSWLEAGGHLLAVPRSAALSPSLATLLGVPDLRLEEVTAPDYVLLGVVDFQHPFLSPFSEPAFHDFTKIHFWKYRRLDASKIPGARVFGHFDRGDAAMVEVPVGRGVVVLWTSGWLPSDSQLGLSSKFVPLLYGMFESGLQDSHESDMTKVGDTFVFPTAAQPRSLHLPDGTTLSISPQRTEFMDTVQPGLYRLEGPGFNRTWAVNLDPAESRTVALTASELFRRGLPMEKRPEISNADKTSPQRSSDIETEGHQKLWRLFILATLAILILESVIAGLRSYQSVPVQGLTP